MLTHSTQAEVTTNILTEEEMINWLKTTDAELTFIGEPIPGINAPEGLSSREALVTTVTYCSVPIDNICGGSCTVYTGGAACLNAPGTSCLAATNNVAFCSSSGYVPLCTSGKRQDADGVCVAVTSCTGNCNERSACVTPMGGSHWYTPNTESSLVGDY